MRTTKKALNHLFFALSDDKRRDMLKRLADRPATVGELAKPLKISAPAVSKHLKTLEHAGLITRTIRGRTHEVRISVEGLAKAANWISARRNATGARLDAIETLMRKERAKKTRRGG